MKKLILILISFFVLQISLPLCAKDKAHLKELSTNFDYLYNQLKGENLKANGEGILDSSKIISANMKYIKEDISLVKKAFEIIKLYEEKNGGALFINKATKNGLVRKDAKGKEIHFAIAEIQQGLIDNIYTSYFLQKYPEIFANNKFESSDKFPGKAPFAENALLENKVKVKAQNRKSWGSPFLYEKLDARRPTGYYAPAGAIVTITVPKSMVGKNYKIRVGSHSWDNAIKPKMLRLDRISIVYPITSTQTLVSNPMGGGIYMEIPYLADLGVVEIGIKNAIKAPYFSAKSFDKTSLEQWQKVERKAQAPWGDFETDLAMINVPTKWIYNFDDPISLMKKWDSAMETIVDLRGWTGSKRDKTILYLQADLQMRGAAFFPGYPQTNDRYLPNEDVAGNNKLHYFLKGPKASHSSCFHELGHAVYITKFRGEVEAIVNFLYVAIMNQKFDVDMDTAFIRSFYTGHNFKGISEVAQMWLVKDNFRAGKEMNCTNKPGDEMKYQYTGYAKYVDYVNLFGWEALNSFFRAYELDYMGKKEFFPKVINKDDVDNRIFQLSKAANCDVRPLIHFWGIQPENPKALADRIAKARLKPSKAIYDKLIYYKSIILANNQEFRDFAKKVYPKGIEEDEKTINNGVGWYFKYLTKYDEHCAEESRQALQNIIDMYFPNF